MSATNRPSLDPEFVRYRVRQFFELRELGKELALTGLRMRHPDAGDDELVRRFEEQLESRRRRKWGCP